MGRTCCVQKLFWMSEIISVHNMFSPGLSLEFSCIELVIQWKICHHIVDAKKELLTKIYLYKLSFDLYFKILLMVYKLNVMAICQMPKYLRFDRTHAKNSSNRQKNIQLDEQWEESQLPPILRVKIIFWSINNRVSKLDCRVSAKDVQILFFETNFYPYIVVIVVVTSVSKKIVVNTIVIHYWV